MEKKFWDVGPHDRLSVEDTWNKFIEVSGGNRVDEELSKNPDFDNADYIYKEDNIILELKEIETEFLRQEKTREKYNQLIEKLKNDESYNENALIDDKVAYPSWFNNEFQRLAKPAIDRVLKKANKQIKETKKYFGVNKDSGVIIFVNDGFTDINPYVVSRLAQNSLIYSYSSIDCFLYMTVNRYVELPGDNEPKLLWVPAYSEKASDDLHDFINELGRKWFDFMEEKIGPFTSRTEIESSTILDGAKAIILPNEEKNNDTIVDSLKNKKFIR